MKRKIIAISVASVFALSAAIGGLLSTNYYEAYGEVERTENSVTVTADDIRNAMSTGSFSKGQLEFEFTNLVADGNRIIFKGLDDLGENVSEKPSLRVVTGSIPNEDGSYSGQGYNKIDITGYDGTGYGLLGVNSYEKADGIDYIGYQQLLPKADQSVIPFTNEQHPTAKYVHLMGKIGADYSITSATFCWICDGYEPIPTDTNPYLGEPYITFNNDDNYYVMDGFSNGGMFLSTWNKNNLSLDNGIAGFTLSDNLTLSKNEGTEIKSIESFKYGYFGARMKAFAKEGTVQSVFTYSNETHQDEIDIEILGKDTTKVQFNYYQNGVGDHEYVYDLGFDAKEAYHDYGFKWEENHITWYVDHVMVYEVEAYLKEPGNLFANVWAGNSEVEGISTWLGEYQPSETSSVAYYDYLSYAPLNSNPTLSISSPRNKSSVSTVEKEVNSYIFEFKAFGAKKENDYLLDINEVNTTNHNPRVSNFTTGKNLSKGKAVEITFETELEGPYQVHLSSDSSFEDEMVVETNTKEASFYNLFIATEYFVKITCGEKESLVYSFTTKETSRMIYTSLTYNIRDIGGKMTKSGKRVKQGLIYRGQELVPEAYTDSSNGEHVKTVDESSLNTLKNELGIGFEIDLRSKTELPNPDNLVSPVGFNYWTGAMDVSSGWVPAYNYVTRDTNNLKMYKYIFQNMLQVQNSPVYFHCWGGLDRTGTVAFILEGLLGCNFTDICIDYELSSFSGSSALRQRDVDYQSGGKGFKTMVTQLVNNSAASDKYNGYNPNGTNDIQEICENILLKAGITSEEIELFRSIMLED